MDSNDQEMSEHEADLLNRSTKPQKEELTSNPRSKVSFLESLLLNMEDPNIKYVTQSLDNIVSQTNRKTPKIIQILSP
ncbi:hypothetical protein MTR67_034645 [Solanum verrucosum]|uniref:Uncharacterized protein n=1 Tax=Solanum verrucosum TaxID=315347 RepID=A0AAF0U865_SOLVR|nr:hypothetical protein MTR67_034645 [Solanum verrucosum]